MIDELRKMFVSKNENIPTDKNRKKLISPKCEDLMTDVENLITRNPYMINY